MSLINQMLRDLEARRAGDSEKQSLPNEVRSLPPASMGQRWAKRLLAAALGIAAIALIAWSFVESTTQPAPVPKPAAKPAPQPTAPVQHESALKLDPDLTEARLPPMLPAVPRPTPKPPVATQPAVAVPPTEPVAAPATPKAQVEKRAPASEANSSPTQRAREQLNAGQRDAAEATLKQALAATSGHVTARQMLFALLMEQRRSDEALTVLKEGLAILPNQTQWASNAARLQVDKDDAAGAWATLQHSLPAAAAQGDYRAFCGTVLTRLKRYGEAIEHYQAALRTNPTEGRWWVGMALALEADGRTAEAREAFARAQGTGKLIPELAAFVESKLKQ